MTKAAKSMTGWKTVKFGDVVRLSKERSQDPVADGYERFIGLEHIDPEDLRIRRWGNVADGITFTNVFKPGQVLFGKRRAYQRKVAVADFSGICSGDIYVLESKDPKILLPEIIPFLCQTDAFFQHAIETSAGSLSPRTNWTSLGEFKFRLPSLEEQFRLADLFLTFERTLNSLEETVRSSSLLSKALIKDFLAREWKQCSLRSVILNTQYGLSLNPNAEGAYPMLRMMNLEDGFCVENDIKYVDLNDDEFRTYKLEEGDILFNRTNSYELVGRTGVYTLKGNHVFASYLVRLKVTRELIEPAFLTEFLNSEIGRRQVISFATKGVSQANVNASNLLRLSIPLPPINEQRSLLRIVGDVSQAKLSALSRKEELADIKRNAGNEFWGEGK